MKSPSLGALRNLHSFPTRRSSDLYEMPGNCSGGGHLRADQVRASTLALTPLKVAVARRGATFARLKDVRVHAEARSEEHTSELQSQFHLVCRLLLEKKKSPVLISD